MDELLQEMIAPAPSRSDMARRRRLVSTFVIVALAVVGVASLTTSALFTDNDAITGGAITTGTVDLSTSGLPTFNVPTEGLAPGDAAFAAVTVTSSGSLAYRYAVTYQATDVDTTPGDVTPPPDTAPIAHLSTQLTLTAYVLGTGGTCDAAGTAGAPLASVGAPLATSALAPFIGDVATRDQGSDRTLAATTSEVLCFRVDLPLATTNDFQDTSTTITLRFDAEQTANNP
ncbi:hypothetical protein DDP54_09575 [Cellulomonas sp. WB94]|uniref:hypothetical protein n=1 Tax=Cellulomonas sp. WB94 TaxID=2173174 RepID=UPI000D5839A8|nr:hypothetical protein [Cellulomonas sp. WB94]PVU83201.1 hypothetical protein DDP54_09575 [Cellulomonas sp. WB94]